MKNKVIVACLMMLLSVPAMAKRSDKDPSGRREAAVIDFGTWIDANRILMFVTNKGSFAFDNGGALGKSDGLYYPFTGLDNIASGSNTLTCVFAGSIWAGAQIAAVNNPSAPASVGDTVVTSGQHTTDWSPGPLDANGNPPLDALTNETYRVYKLYADSLADNPNRDYLEWPVANGAPVDSNGNPAIEGDLTLWSVYNDMDLSSHNNEQGTQTKGGLGLEVRQTAFAFAREGALANIVFLRFRIYNKGPYDLTNMYISLWSDPDNGDASDDFVGCDTILSLGYCYNEDDDANYGSIPPAVGYDFFQGPLEFTGDDADTAIMWGFQKFPQYRNLGMVSFNKYINGTDPDSPTQSYWYMLGLSDINPGEPLIDPNTGDTTLFYGSGDPVTGTGFIDFNSSDRRWMQNTGPFDFAAGDSTEIVAAVVIAQGNSPLSAITEMKAVDLFAQTVYDREFQLPTPPAKPDIADSNITKLDRELFFEWGTASEDNPGDFPFEGYTLLQGASATGPYNDTLGWFDITNGIGTIIDFRVDPLSGLELAFNAKPGPDEGLRHSFRVTRDFTSGSSLVNYKTYFFRLESYSADLSQPSGEKTLTRATEFTARAEPLIVGTTINTEAGTDLAVRHDTVLGLPPSPGIATVMVVNPADVTGDDYKIIFSTDPTLGNVWHVVNTSTGDTVVQNWTNQSGLEGADNYPVFDGLQAFVSGPPPSIEEFQMVANASGPLSPFAAGALAFPGFPTPNGENPGDGSDTQAGQWAIHTADNGGSCAGGTRGPFEAFIARATRDGGNFPAISDHDYEMRFTGDPANPGVNGSYAIEAFTLTENVFWVPFELWDIGVNVPKDSPNNPADDVRLTPWIIDGGDDDTYNLESYGCPDSAATGGDGEHSASGGDNDPFTDWVYWYRPADASPGEAGYLADEAAFLTVPHSYEFDGTEILARTVLVSWNGGDAPPFAQDMPEVGTVFRILTAKPNSANDEFVFSSKNLQPTVLSSGGDKLLDDVRAVPNPYYLFSDYDDSFFNRVMIFTNLPEKCTITIYNLGGDLVNTIEKDDASTTSADWNLENESGVPVGSGIYIYVVDADAFGQKIGKMAIFTEVELLEEF